MKNKQAFTLIELLVVILIIGILAAVALPQYRIAVEKSRVATIFPLFNAIAKARTSYELATGNSTCDLDEMDIDIPYTSKIETSENSFCSGKAYKYEIAGGTLSFSNWTPAINFKKSGMYEIYWYNSPRNIYGIQGHGWCEGMGTTTLGDKVCKVMGTATSHRGGYGTTYYAL